LRRELDVSSNVWFPGPSWIYHDTSVSHSNTDVGELLGRTAPPALFWELQRVPLDWASIRARNADTWDAAPA
jgi:hypothetical protein